MDITIGFDSEGIPRTDTKLIPILEALKSREPAFHHRELVSTMQDVDNETTEDYWEVGASGRTLSSPPIFRERRL